MTDTPAYTPPEVWVWDKDDSPKWRYGNINRPIAGATHEKALARGKHPLQLYSLATPNGVKVTVMLEELLAAGHSGAEYDAWLIRIGEGNQFGSGFVGVNPNSKIPALMDYSEQTPRRVFESGAILLYLEWSTAPAGRLKNNCTSAMTPAISRPKRRTRSARAGNPSQSS
jgi:GST-like protein